MNIDAFLAALFVALSVGIITYAVLIGPADPRPAAVRRLYRGGNQAHPAPRTLYRAHAISAYEAFMSENRRRQGY